MSIIQAFLREGRVIIKCEMQLNWTIVFIAKGKIYTQPYCLHKTSHSWKSCNLFLSCIICMYKIKVKSTDFSAYCTKHIISAYCRKHIMHLYFFFHLELYKLKYPILPIKKWDKNKNINSMLQMHQVEPL